MSKSSNGVAFHNIVGKFRKKKHTFIRLGFMCYHFVKTNFGFPRSVIFAREFKIIFSRKKLIHTVKLAKQNKKSVTSKMFEERNYSSSI